MSNTAEELEKDTVSEQNESEKAEIGATESRLLQAMSMPETLAEEALVPVDYVAYAGKELEGGQKNVSNDPDPGYAIDDELI